MCADEGLRGCRTKGAAAARYFKLGQHAWQRCGCWQRAGVQLYVPLREGPAEGRWGRAVVTRAARTAHSKSGGPQDGGCVCAAPPRPTRRLRAPHAMHAMQCHAAFFFNYAPHRQHVHEPMQVQQTLSWPPHSARFPQPWPWHPRPQPLPMHSVYVCAVALRILLDLATAAPAPPSVSFARPPPPSSRL